MERLVQQRRWEEDFLENNDINPVNDHFKDQLQKIRPQLEAYVVSLTQRIRQMEQERDHVLRQIAGIKKIWGEADD